MPTILFPCQDIRYEQIPASSPQFSALARLGLTPQTPLKANKPYCSAEDPTSRAITRSLSCLNPQARANLLHTVDIFGDQTVALAEVYDRHIDRFDMLFSTGSGLTGATATSVQNRLTDFQKALHNYQKSLIDLNNHNRGGRGGAARRAELRRVARSNYDVLQTKFKVELNRFIPRAHVGKNRGNALASADRGITLANRKASRQLYITNVSQAQKVSRFASYARFAGRTTVVVEAGFRTNSTYSTYKAGGNWQREAAIQATGFGFGGAAGIKVGGGVVAGLTAIGLGLTPVGWVVLIGVGVAAGLTAAKAGDWAGTELATFLHDRNN